MAGRLTGIVIEQALNEARKDTIVRELQNATCDLRGKLYSTFLDAYVSAANEHEHRTAESRLMRGLARLDEAVERLQEIVFHRVDFPASSDREVLG